MRVRGMRDVASTQVVANRRPNSREQAITDLARLEHEKARLQRELMVWTTKQQATDRRLEQITAQLEVLQETLEYTSSERAKTGADQKAAAQADGADAGLTDTKLWKEIQLEY